MINLFLLASLSLVVLIIFIRYFEKIFIIFLTLSPFYYSYILVIGWSSGEETFIFRAGKDILIALLLIAWLIRSIISKNASFKFNTPNILIFLYMLSGLFILLTNEAYDSYVYLRVFIEFTLFSLVSKSIFTNEEIINDQLLRWIFVSGFVSIIGIIEYSLGGVDTIFSKTAGQIRIISTLFNPNALGWYLVLSIAMTIGYISDNAAYLSKNKKIFLVTILLSNFIAIVLSGSRSSLLLAVFSILIWLVLIGKTRIFLSTISLVLIFLAALFILVDIEQLQSMRIFSGFQTTRFEIANDFFAMYSKLTKMEFLFGADKDTLLLYKDAGLIYDSHHNMHLLYGGIIGTIIFIAINLFAGGKLLKLTMNKKRGSTSLFLVWILTIILGFLGNILSIFPHALFFWVVVGIAFSNTYKTSTKKAKN